MAGPRHDARGICALVVSSSLRPPDAGGAGPGAVNMPVFFLVVGLALAGLIVQDRARYLDRGDLPLVSHFLAGLLRGARLTAFKAETDVARDHDLVWAALATLTALEIVLGIDVVFISILVSRLPAEQAARARRIGLSLALAFRILVHADVLDGADRRRQDDLQRRCRGGTSS